MSEQHEPAGVPGDGTPGEGAPGEDTPEQPAPEGPPAQDPVTETPRAEVPPPEELRLVARPATHRRAPRLRAFIWIGVLVFALAGVVVALAVPGGNPANRNAAVAMAGLYGAVLGAAVGSGAGLLADWRSRRRR